MKEDLQRRFSELNPKVLPYEKALRASMYSLGTAMVGVLISIGIHKSLGLSPSEEQESLVWIVSASLSLGLFFLSISSFMLFSHMSDKAYALAVLLWDKTDNPSIEQLARLSVSHEFSSAHRKAAALALDKRDPHWRQRILALSCSKSVFGEISLPEMGQVPKEGKYALLFAPLALSGVGLGVIGLLKSSDGFVQSWPWFVASITVNAVFIYLAERFIDGPQNALKRKWEAEMAQSFSVDQIIEFEAANSKTVDGKLARAWLDKHSPGWSLSPSRPLWAVACVCEE